MSATLSLEKIDDIRRFARTIFYKNQYMFKSTTIEDIEQDFLLEYLQIENIKLLAKSVIYKYTANKDKVSVRDFIPLSVFEYTTEKSGDTYNFLEESELFAVYDNYYSSNTENFINKIAILCYPDREDLQERIFKYLYGEKIKGDEARGLRRKFFKKAKEILSYYLSFDKISKREFFKYSEYLENMSEYAPQKRKHIDTAENKACREYYERTKERQRKRMRENYYKLKAKK